jgi:hypothetical protein
MHYLGRTYLRADSHAGLTPSGSAVRRWHVFATVLGLLAGCFSGSAHADDERCVSAHVAAQEARAQHHLIAARVELLVCAQTACPGPVRNDCISWLAAVEHDTPSLVFAVSDTSGKDVVEARVSSGEQLIAERADGRAVALDPGVYTLRYEAAGYAPVLQTLSVREAEQGRLVRVEMTPSTPSSARAEAAAAPAADPRTKRLRRAALAMSAVALSAGGVAFIGLRGRALQDEVRAKDQAAAQDPSQAAPDPTAQGRAWDRGNRLIAGSWAATSLAGASAGAALWLYLAAHKRTTRQLAEPRAHLSASPQAGGVFLSLAGAF